ncbi:MAG TPA: two-component system response regulator [Myxococcales bacterium]|mgnify:FL=1|nr:two-component system response regulator [Deltaproteobacteria bacterium]MBU54854.1 two-component system response regulator [Deltaproteobacteria bacterium]HAA57557.1 two-component system response regulator [Myxococcales bacterium]
MKPRNILIVDDEPTNQELLAAMVELLGHNVILESGGPQALARLDHDIDLLLLDLMMPGMNGFEVVSKIREDAQYKNFKDIPIILVTALSDKAQRLKAVEVGANDFIAKPVEKIELKVRIGSLLKMKEAQDELKRHRQNLEDIVVERTSLLEEHIAKISKMKQELYEANIETIRRLAVASEYKDEDTGAHILRMSRYANLLAEKLHLSSDEAEIIRHASTMHDVGKIAIPDAILMKPGKLTPEEWKIMQQHTVIGAKMLANASSELLSAGAVIALNHHEKWDGSGYPNGLSGQKIPLWGRICALADVFDALTSERPYKKAFSLEKARSIMQEGKGSHFDPQLLDIFMDNFEEFTRIKKTLSNDTFSDGALVYQL